MRVVSVTEAKTEDFLSNTYFSNSFISSTTILSFYHVPCTVLGDGVKIMSKTRRGPSYHGLYIPMEKMDNNHSSHKHMGNYNGDTSQGGQVQGGDLICSKTPRKASQRK